MLLASQGVASADAKQRYASLSGIYSNVQVSCGTGVMRGLEIEFHATGAKPYALVVLCQGYCHFKHQVPLSLHRGRFELAFAEHYADDSSDETKYHLEGHRVGRLLIVDTQMVDNQSRTTYRGRYTLKPQKKRIGLIVAAPPKEALPYLDRRNSSLRSLQLGFSNTISGQS